MGGLEGGKGFREERGEGREVRGLQEQRGTGPWHGWAPVPAMASRRPANMAAPRRRPPHHAHRPPRLPPSPRQPAYASVSQPPATPCPHTAAEARGAPAQRARGLPRRAARAPRGEAGCPPRRNLHGFRNGKNRFTQAEKSNIFGRSPKDLIQQKHRGGGGREKRVLAETPSFRIRDHDKVCAQLETYSKLWSNFGPTLQLGPTRPTIHPLVTSVSSRSLIHRLNGSGRHYNETEPRLPAIREA